MTASRRGTEADLVEDYRLTGFDEMFSEAGVVRPHYAPLLQRLAEWGAADIRRRHQVADLMMRHQGITFTVYGRSQGVERIIPFDPVPRLVPADEWERIDRGLQQRVRALNLFIHDVYHERLILKDRLVPPELVLGASGYRREAVGITVPRNIYIHISGIDLIRDTNGSYLVLEDNCRTPSGVSYVLKNREVMKQVFPFLFRRYDVRPIDDYASNLSAVLRHIAPSGAENPTVVVLTPGLYNSAYYEHSFLARQMGVELVEGRDLVLDNGQVFMRTTAGLQKIDVIYRRVDDDFLDPLTFRRDSQLGVAGLMGAYRAGNVALANSIGTGVADDKGIYPFVPDIIRYYLKEDAILANVETFRPLVPAHRQHILANLDKLVVKAVDGSGGYGMLIGPASTAEQREEFARKIESNPRGYIAQPTITLSQHPTMVENHLEGRHVDLRPYILYGDDIKVLPGGLTRVALPRGSLVVNSSQGGGTKDTWVLRGDVADEEEWLLSRVAENLYWIGRYVERAENLARLLDDAFHFELDAAALNGEGNGALDGVLGILSCQESFAKQQNGGGRDELLRFLTFERQNGQSILNMVSRARENARGAQEALTSDTWSRINQLYLYLSGKRAERRFKASPFRFYESIKRGCVLFVGLVNSTLPRTEVYHLLQTGRYLERVDSVSRTIAIKFQGPRKADGSEDLSFQHVHLASLLRSCGAYEAYLKTYRDRLDPRHVVQYLVLDASFPRALRYCVARCLESLNDLSGSDQDGYRTEAERLLGRLEGELRYADVDEILTRGLDKFLQGVQESVGRIHSTLGQAYFLT